MDNHILIPSLFVMISAVVAMARENIKLREDVARLTLKSCFDGCDEESFKKSRQVAYYVNLLLTASSYLKGTGEKDLVDSGIYIEEQVLKGKNPDDCCSDCWDVKELREQIATLKLANSLLNTTVLSQDETIRIKDGNTAQLCKDFDKILAERDRLKEYMARVYLDNGESCKS